MPTETQLDPLSISADLLYAVKTDGSADELREYLATLERDRLERALRSHRHRLSFWLNCYNAYAQLSLEDDPSALDRSALSRWRFLRRERVPVAGVWLSLADIEHGMLRSSSHPWGLGYLPRPFPSAFERSFRLESVDPRIHFALSRGEENCPPLTVYSPVDCESELDIATEWYIEANVSYDPETDVVQVPPVFFRYRGDFGGRSGVRAFLKKYDGIPQDSSPTLEYTEIDWALEGVDFRR